MDKREAIEELKQELDKIPALREQYYDNPDFKLWKHGVETIIKAALDYDDLKTFSSAKPISFPMCGISPENEFTKHYQKELTDYETALKSIIQKYDIFGVEDKPANKTEQKDTITSPIHLFDTMQFHPKIIEASRALFKDGHYRDAIYRAFVALNNLVKDKSGLPPQELRGMKESKIMAKIFDVNSPIIKLNKLSTETDISEQEGFKFLFMGATIGMRNPKAHENIIQNDPYRTLEYLGFASLLLKTIDFWEARTS